MSFPRSIFFTRAQLMKLHGQFAHPTATRLYNILRRAPPEETSAENVGVLDDRTKLCDPCQRIQRGPNRFRVSFGAEDTRFNEIVVMDVMYLDWKPVLHIVDEGTRFSAARFVSDVSTKTIWRTFLECWAAVYTGLPHKILVDQANYFGPVFANIGALSRVEVQRTGAEAHSSLGLGERYHEPLRTTVRKLKAVAPDADPNFLLSFSVKAMNDTIGPEGLVPSALGISPPLGRSMIRFKSDRHLQAMRSLP